MKNKKRIFIIKIFSLLLLGIISITLLGSWTYNPSNDTITSDNLSNYSHSAITENGLTSVVQNNKVTTNGIADSTWGVIGIFRGVLQAGTYTISITPQENWMSFYQWYDDGWSIDVHDNTITLTTDTTINCRIITTGGITLNNYIGYVMLNSGSTVLPYEPYGQTYVNQQRLDDLELDYDDLMQEYSQLQDDLSALNQQYLQLQQDYDTLNDNYGILEYNYGQLQSELDSLQYDYNELSYNYEQLQQQYEDLDNIIQPFVFDYSQFQINIGNATQTGDNFVATQAVSNISTYFDEFGGFNLDTLYNNYSGFGSTYSSIEFIVPNLNLVYFNAMFSFTGMPDMNYRIYLTNSIGQNTSFSYDIKDIVFDNQQTNLNFTILGGIIHSNSDVINEFVLPLQYTNYSRIILTGLNVGALNVHKISFGSTYGYNIGFQDGYTSIKSLTDTTISSLRNTISQKDETIKILNNQIADLNQQVLNAVGWKPLFFAIADTPLKTISNVLGFELFGINLFQAFVGIVTALSLIWLIKKLLGK